jgi:pilus assembly protein Flp/PilA
MTMFSRFMNDESGATAIEYGLIAAIVGVGIIRPGTLQVALNDTSMRVRAPPPPLSWPGVAGASNAFVFELEGHAQEDASWAFRLGSYSGALVSPCLRALLWQSEAQIPGFYARQIAQKPNKAVYYIGFSRNAKVLRLAAEREATEPRDRGQDFMGG